MKRIRGGRNERKENDKKKKREDKK